MSDTGEIQRGGGNGNGNGSFRKFTDAVIVALTIAAITSGVSAYVKGEVTSAQLAAQEKRVDGIVNDIKGMRAELLLEMRETRAAVERKR